MSIAPLHPIDHAPWCDQDHPQTKRGGSYLVTERNWITAATPYTDAALNRALLDAFHEASAQEGTPLLRKRTPGGDALMRLCAAVRFRELEQQVASLIVEAGRRTRVN